MNIKAVVGLAICTAFFRANFDNQTKPSEVEDQDAWEDIAKHALEYLQWVAIDTNNIKIDKYTIGESIWGFDVEELNQRLS
jgi:hypothetical protein